jgi:hypothetical protein
MDKSMLQSIKKTRDKVRMIMEEIPETRNNDNLLCTMFWRHVDEVEDLAGLQFATPAEAIRRSRQLINQAGHLLATDPAVLEKRRQSAREMRAGITRI